VRPKASGSAALVSSGMGDSSCAYSCLAIPAVQANSAWPSPTG